MYNNGNTSKNVTGASVVDGTIANADIDASAAIAQSKLATLAITDSEVADNALSGDKIDGGTISNFTSTGIDDNASAEKVDITDSVIDVLTGANLRAVDGVLFGSDTASANMLDDYEEGKYTPTLTCSTSGSYSFSGSFKTLSYTKIGRVVTIGGFLKVASESSPNGNLQLSLPFTANNLSHYASTYSGTLSLRDHGGSVDHTAIMVWDGGSTASFVSFSGGGVETTLDHDDVDSSFRIYLSLTYLTDA